MDFALYDNDQCGAGADPPIFSQEDVPLVNASATSNWTSITSDGTYNWQITYSGDGSNNAPFTSACGETTTIELP